MKFIRRLDIARPPGLATALACALCAGAAFAASDGEHREHDAHEHGHGTLDIALEGEELVVELRIPAVNVVGFEHAPRDDAEREAVRQAMVPFGDAASVLVLPAEAECEVEKVDAEIFSMTHEDDEEEGHRDEDGHDHEGDENGDGHGTDEHAKDEHEEHEEDAHEEHDPDSGAEAHSEMHATYQFHCHAPGRIGRVDVRVFEHLRDAEEIDVRIVTPTAQLATELNPGSTVVELSP